MEEFSKRTPQLGGQFVGDKNIRFPQTRIVIVNQLAQGIIELAGGIAIPVIAAKNGWS